MSTLTMHLRFTYTRYTVGLVKKQDGSNLIGYRCELCGEKVAEDVAANEVSRKPELLMYPDKRVMDALAKHDATHQPPPEPITLEGKTS